MSKVATQADGTQVEILTEEDLAKSIADLEGKAPQPKDPPKPVLETEGLKKTLVQSVEENKKLSQVIDAAPVLKEFVGTLSTHVDNALEVMAKNYGLSAERDLGLIRVIGELKKSIDANTVAVKELGNQPGAPAGKDGTGTKTDVLSKGVGESPDPKKMKEKVLAGLEKLTKSFPPGTQEGLRWMQATSKFESTGSISDQDLAEAIRVAEGK